MKCDKLQRYSLDVDYEEQALAVPDDKGTYMDASEVDAAIDELKTGHHKERHEYIEMVAQLRRDNRRLLRALWLARADRAKDKQTYYTHTRGDGWVHRVDKWIEIEHKCLNKAEEYK